MVLQDPGIHASDTKLYHGVPTHLAIRGTGFWLGSRTPRKTDRKVYKMVPPKLDFDPPINPAFISGISVIEGKDVSTAWLIV